MKLKKNNFLNKTVVKISNFSLIAKIIIYLFKIFVCEKKAESIKTNIFLRNKLRRKKTLEPNFFYSLIDFWENKLFI